MLAFTSFSWNGVCWDMHLLPCRYHDDACFSFVFSTDVAVFGAHTLSRSRDLKRHDGLHQNTDVRSMFYVFDTLAVHVLTSMKASHRDVCGRLLRPMNGLHRHDFISVRSTPLVLISRAWLTVNACLDGWLNSACEFVASQNCGPVSFARWDWRAISRALSGTKASLPYFEDAPFNTTTIVDVEAHNYSKPFNSKS